MMGLARPESLACAPATQPDGEALVVPTRFRRRLPEVDAVILTPNNADAVAAWCGGRLVTRDVDGVEEQQLMIPGSAIPASLGMFVVREAEMSGRWRYYPIKAEVFGFAYEQVDPLDAEEHF